MSTTVRVAAEVAIRPAQYFDMASTDWCLFHRDTDSTHVATVLVNGHVVLEAAVCGSCAQLMETGTDWRGRPAGRGDRALGR